MSLITSYNKKRRGRSRYLLSVLVDVVKDGECITAKVVYMPQALVEKQKAKAIKQAKKLLLREGIISESQLVS